MTQGMNQKARDALVAAIPVGRIGLPEDIWLAVKFVLECDYFNGRTHRRRRRPLDVTPTPALERGDPTRTRVNAVRVARFSALYRKKSLRDRELSVKSES